MKNWKIDFPWFQNHPNLIYLDNAATTLKPKVVIDASTDFYTNKTFAFNLFHEQVVVFAQEIHATRTELAEYLGADRSEIYYTSGATESLNEISFALQFYLHEEDEILVSYMEHGSNLLPWYRLQERNFCKLCFFNKNQYNFDFDDLLQKINKNTKIVALNNASNLLAFKIDIKQVISAIKSKKPDILIVLDATQYLEHDIINCHDVDCDFLVGSAHKLMGPTGLGFLYIKNNTLKKFSVWAFSSLIENNQFNENSTLNWNAIYAFKFALRYWKKISIWQVKEQEQKLKTYFLNQLKHREDLIFYNESISSPLITINFKNSLNKIVDGQDIEFYLEQKNILTRSSLSCAKLARYPLKTRSVVRASLFFYNDEKDMDALASAINAYNEGDELNGLI